MIDRYGIPPELVPDFIGLKGDTSDNIPGVPGIGDKTAADLLQRFGSLEGVLDSIDEISGAKRKENLTNHAEDARVSKHLATAKRDIPLDGMDVARARLRAARPLTAARGLPRVRAARAAAPPRGGAGLRRRRRARPGRRAGARGHAARGLAAGCRAAAAGRGGRRGAARRSCPRAPCSPPNENEWRFGVYIDETREVIVGTVPRPEELVAALGTRPVIAHDAKSLGLVPANLAHDTEVAAYLLEPAARAYPFRELCEDRGLAADVER